jgi:hypothetical protein
VRAALRSNAAAQPMDQPADELDRLNPPALPQARSPVRPRSQPDHQRECVSFSKAMDLAFREADRAEAVSLAFPGGEQQSDPFRLQPTRNEKQRVGGRLVQPVRVVYQADQPSVCGEVGDQGQGGHGNKEPVRHRRRR